MGGLGVERVLGFSRGGRDQRRRGEPCGEGLAHTEEGDDGWGPPISVRRGAAYPFESSPGGPWAGSATGPKRLPTAFFSFF
jgi:hypothetical protein